ncbi:hypothetical protein LCGC14_2570240 [marine sediment metagenome]|uniref:Uncharacterized protein n=1 Tax=marine sediment metagenome TaxID=412755 RepID=A0A0F9DAC5_9ZZZZ
MREDDNQSYFWTDEWQIDELEADEDIRLGRVKHFNGVEELIVELNSEDNNAEV